MALKARVADTARAIWSSRVVFVANVQITGSQTLQEVRSKLKADEVNMKFVKNAVASVALRDFPDRSPLGNILVGQTALLYSDNEDILKPLQTVTNIQKDYDQIMILGGACEQTLLTREGIESALKLPSMTELQRELLGLLMSPAHNLTSSMQSAHGAKELVRAMEEPGRKTASALDATSSSFVSTLEQRKFLLEKTQS